ncbi:helix-turn-helix transcriptional regulator [Janthinobacterium sp. RB2R34]|uniref:helix-turn-helix transcriptional regulator n=1 Tax=Janthinobacterium sp. RB2R34 TaxID=3424193 RepID=UPI003F525CDE
MIALMAMLMRAWLDWHLSSQAATCHMSRANFARVFRQVAGTTPAALLQQLRMAQAAQWLRQDGRPVAEIGEQAGYQSEAAFNRVFKRHFGVGPGKYRRMATLKAGAPPAPAA